MPHLLRVFRHRAHFPKFVLSRPFPLYSPEPLARWREKQSQLPALNLSSLCPINGNRFSLPNLKYFLYINFVIDEPQKEYTTPDTTYEICCATCWLIWFPRGNCFQTFFKYKHFTRLYNVHKPLFQIPPLKLEPPSQSPLVHCTV